MTVFAGHNPPYGRLELSQRSLDPLGDRPLDGKPVAMDKRLPLLPKICSSTFRQRPIFLVLGFELAIVFGVTLLHVERRVGKSYRGLS
jgi:hypothetical protein